MLIRIIVVGLCLTGVAFGQTGGSSRAATHDGEHTDAYRDESGRRGHAGFYEHGLL
jgi:hypothetical protein